MRRIIIAALLAAGLCGAQVIYKVRLPSEEGGRIVELPAEEYVAGVLAGESSTFRSVEALKAMAVAARTYAARLRGRHAAEGYDFCATTHCQRLELGSATAQSRQAAQATGGELLWFEGKPVMAVYTRDCGGESESAGAVWPEAQAPYLIARADPYCTRHGAAGWSWTARPDELAAALRASGLRAPEGFERVMVAGRTASGRAQRLELIGRNDEAAISASSLRFAVGRDLGWNTLRSDRYEIENREGRIRFRGTGEGHGAGLCQHGADEMGVEGHTYREILGFYYPGTVVARTGAGLKWLQMTGEGVSVVSTNPDRDRMVLSTAEALHREVGMRLGWTADAVTIRVYPDVETFRNATGEPGWVAARTSGREVELQPVALLRARGILKRTLRHELFHAAIEQRAAPGLPVWFREGLAEYLDGDKVMATERGAANDTDFEQRLDRQRAQAAYGEASVRVRELVARYGEAAVLGWVAGGLPAEVRNSSTRSAPAKSK